MDNARASLLVGTVVLLGIAAFVALYSITGAGIGSDDTYEVYGLFDDVSGLAPKTRVTVAGVKVGEIVSIGIDPDSPDRARVVIALRRDVAVLAGVRQPDGSWANGATLTRKSASLLGDMYLELTRGVEGPPLGQGDRIRQAVSISGLGAVMKQLEKSQSLFARLDGIFVRVDAIAADIQAVTGTVKNILGGPKGEAQLQQIADNVRMASEDIKLVIGEVKIFTSDVRTFLGDSVLGRGDQIGRIVGNVEQFTHNAAMLSSTASASSARILADVEAVTGDIRHLIRGSKNEVETSLGTIKGALAQFTQTMKKVDAALESIASITAKIDSGEGTIGTLINDDRLIKDVEEVVADASNLIKSVTGIQTRVELSSEFYVGQRSLKNYLRLRLAPKEDKYYLIELIDDPRGKTVNQVQVTQTNDPTLPPVVHETQSTTTDGIKFSFQFAKKWHFMTGRFGVFEGTGGLGIDGEFFDDTLKLSVDVFDFTQDESPRLRALTNYQFFQHFFLSAGVDDMLNAQSFDWFLGFGIRFTDDDLKGLLTVAPLPGL